MPQDYQFMADFTLPERWPEEMVELLPFQQEFVDQLFVEGKLLHYAISVEKAKLWAVFNAGSEIEVMEWINDLPFSPYLRVDVTLLTAYEGPEAAAPAFSLN